MKRKGCIISVQKRLIIKLKKRNLDQRQNQNKIKKIDWNRNLETKQIDSMQDILIKDCQNDIGIDR